MKLLLASRSATRRRLLEQAAVPFEAVVAPLDEEAAKRDFMTSGLSPREIAAALAEAKAQSVSGSNGALVLGADQVLELDDGMMLSKPASRDEALAQLRRMSGHTHQLHSAAALVADAATVWSATESVAMTMRPLSDGFLGRYLDAEYDAVRGNVGSYRIEGLGAQLFERVEGSHFAILGLPLLPLLSELRARGLLDG